jgi:hypothetical protein
VSFLQLIRFKLLRLQPPLARTGQEGGLRQTNLALLDHGILFCRFWRFGRPWRGYRRSFCALADPFYQPEQVTAAPKRPVA